MTLLRRIYRAPELFQLLATFALVLVFKDAALWLWGPEDLLGPRAPGTDAIPEGIEAQSRAVLANVRAVLEASGAGWSDLVDVTVFLTDMAGDCHGWNAAWAEHFPDPAQAPCRTTVGITALPTPIAIELKCIAVLP